MRYQNIARAAQDYMVCALWSEGDDDGNPLDSRYVISDIVEQEEMREDVEAFIEACESERPDVFDGMDPGQIGHDFWLTRNHHGTGFWDRGLGERGDWLAKQAQSRGDAGLYVGDDGRVHYES